ncbi:DUF2000 domain-containing protein [Fusibacter ferrireducens]|uniref:DUF2000 domain-containing protein n=1 Tax=Fusibacter ferrireducens TaxID=2785058 RepID=A0ABR9ZRJ5_9FIRM|nr:DUF2000 domain-containing protein [Fusibacter ferrireducens]MBF4693073.1 DUF2000 domain-containing protein [Fusibacter ferrireducens]
MKCVMIIDLELPLGIQMNTAAALGISLASAVEGLTGKSVVDQEGHIYEGITNVPIPILALKGDEIKAKYDVLLENQNPELKVYAFVDVAQKSLSYEDYEMKLARTKYADVGFLGLCIYGPKKMVNKLTGNIKMMR